MNHTNLSSSQWEYVTNGIGTFKLSVAVISISLIPRALMSVNTLVEYAEDSFLPSHNPKTSLSPSIRRPMAM